MLCEIRQFKVSFFDESDKKYGYKLLVFLQIIKQSMHKSNIQFAF